MRLLLGTAFCAVLLAPAWAGVTATLTFTTPTATVGPTDSIDIWLTLALSSDSVALITDSGGNVTSGLTQQDIADHLFSPLPDGIDASSATNSNLNEFLSCSGTFIIGCGDPGSPYAFNFNFNQPEWAGITNLDLEPGTTTQWLFGTFTPNGGGAPAGTYVLADVGYFIQVWDANYLTNPDDPNSWLHLADVPIADTSAGPAFTRTVNGADAIPEPGTWAMMLSGLVLAAGLKRRKGARP